MQHLTRTDRLISTLDNVLKVTSGSLTGSQRPSPGTDSSDLTPSERRHSAGLMRINHTGEVCAQALYQGQAITAHNDSVQNTMRRAAREEVDHLVWCQQRLSQLESRVSWLNPIWYLGSLSLGMFAGLLGDRISLGFVAATEEEVTRHLDSHLNQLPAGDRTSTAILEQMRSDELEHEHTALKAGGIVFPGPVKRCMRTLSRLMTLTTYRI